MKNYIWLILIAVFLLLEAGTAGLTTIWFAGGALIAYVVSLFGLGTVWQVMAFVVCSLLLLIFTRPLALKYVNSRTAKTNVVDRIIGRSAVVTEEVNNVLATGKVMVDGMPWTARAQTDGEIIPVGTAVVVESLQGVKCIVKPEEKAE